MFMANMIYKSMHFTSASWDIYSEYDLQIIHFITESWDVYSKYDLQIMHFTELVVYSCRF